MAADTPAVVEFIVFAQPGALSAGAFEEVLAAAQTLDMNAVRRDASLQESAAGATGA